MLSGLLLKSRNTVFMVRYRLNQNIQLKDVSSHDVQVHIFFSKISFVLVSSVNLTFYMSSSGQKVYLKVLDLDVVSKLVELKIKRSQSRVPR